MGTIDSGHYHMWFQHVQSLAKTLGDAVWSTPLWIHFPSFALLPGEVSHQHFGSSLVCTWFAVLSVIVLLLFLLGSSNVGLCHFKDLSVLTGCPVHLGKEVCNNC